MVECVLISHAELRGTASEDETGIAICSKRVHLDCRYGIRAQKPIPYAIYVVVGTYFHIGSLIGPFWSDSPAGPSGP